MLQKERISMKTESLILSLRNTLPPLSLHLLIHLTTKEETLSYCQLRSNFDKNIIFNEILFLNVKYTNMRFIKLVSFEKDGN